MLRELLAPNSKKFQNRRARPASTLFGIGITVAFAAAICLIVALAPSASLRVVHAGTPTVLHFHGNSHDSGGSPPAPCTGDGRADLLNCDGPFLTASGTLDTAQAASWFIANPALDGTGARTIYDPSWIWNSGPVRLGGEMTVDFWASCGACGGGLGNADWTIRVWADGVMAYEEVVRATPDLPNVPKLLSAKVFLPEVIAAQNIVLHVDPVYIDSQNNTKIYYDSQSACPGTLPGTQGPCDSKVTMPVLAPGEPVPTPTPNGAGVTYLKGGINFSPNVPLHAPATVRDGEPSLRVDKYGNAYVAGIRGVPAGCDLWYFDLRPTVNGQPNPMYDPYMRNPLYRGQPDAFTGEAEPSLLADGGGDVDLAVTFPASATEDPNAPPTLAFTSLTAANISVAKSTDRGITFQKNPAGNITGGLPGDDRQWFEAVGSNTVYIFYRTLAPAVSMVQRSTDGGYTFGPARTAGPIGQAGYIDVHKATGTVYISGSTGQVCVGTPATPTDEPLTYTCKPAGPANGANLFFVVKVADDGTPNGTLYVTYSDGTNIFLKSSTDKGDTWTAPIQINNGPEVTKNLFPWIETGSVPGSVGIVWYGTSSSENNNDSDWNVFFAQVTGASTGSPTVRQVKASDHVHHASNISLSGLDPTATDVNRNLIDYFQVAFDPTGAAVIAYTDDHNDYDGNTFVMRQVSGPTVNGGSVPTPVEGSGLPAAPPFSTDGSQVVDPPQDARTSTTILNQNEPVDITSITYSTEGPTNNLVLVGKMKVTDLTAVPPSGLWRMNFAANAPDSVLSPTGLFSFATADRGDQFYLLAQTDGAGAQTYRYGSAIRNGNGGMTYTDRGAADSGSFDAATKTITVKVALSKFNPFVAAGNAAIAGGSVLTGLRGSASIAAAGNAGRSDNTRGGTQFLIPVPRINVALSANGAVASASSSHLSGLYPAAAVINGDRKGNNWGTLNGGWNDGTRSAYPDTLEITFSSAKTIDEINVITLQNNWQNNPGEPTLDSSCTGEGILDFAVEYWNGSAWVVIQNVTGNDKAWRQFTFAPVSTPKIRLVVTASRNNYSRVVELEAFGQ